MPQILPHRRPHAFGAGNPGSSFHAGCGCGCFVAWNEPAGEKNKGRVRARRLIVAVAPDHAGIIDGRSKGKREVWVGRDQGVEIVHFALFPKETTAVIVHIAGRTYDLAKVVDGFAVTGIIPGKSAQVLHGAVLPQGGMTGLIAAEIRSAGDLPEIIDGEGVVVHQPTQTREDAGPAVV